jgi:transposase
MTQERVSMRKTKEVLRLFYDLKLSKRQVARSCNIAPSTVREYLRKAEQAGISWPLPDGMDEAALEARLFPEETAPAASLHPLPDMEYIHQELPRKGVTRQLLWLEYKEKHPDGYEYSQFCELFRQWSKRLDVTLRQEHKAGEKLFVDFAGKGIDVIDPATGVVSEAQIFVAVLGASNYTFVLAVPAQSLPWWITCHTKAFDYFGGLPEIVVPDNLKSGVSKACRYDPDLNPTYHRMGQHYGVAIIPARARKPKDKAKVEAGVLIVTRWITAALRNFTFFSIAELNVKITELLEKLNTRKFKKLPTNRKELFESLEKAILRPLPAEAYEYAEWLEASVNIDYHVEVDGHYYSVLYTFVGKRVGVWLTAMTVEFLLKNTRIWLHPRSYVKGGYTTVKEHRPKSHQKYLEWTPSRIIAWAAANGPQTALLVDAVIKARPHPEQGYRASLGIIRLEKRYGKERLEAAARRALAIRAYSYKSVKSILKTGLDQMPLPLDVVPEKRKEVTLPKTHKNVRGSRYFN